MSKAVEIACELIKTHKLKVPIDVEKLINDLGFSLNITSMESMSGFAYKKNGKRIIGINADEGNNRKRFTMAHELGHMLVHAQTDISFDKKDDFVYFRDDNSTTGLNPREVEANAFAAELLMPSAELKKDIAKKTGGIDLFESDAWIQRLSHKYKVSFAAMSVRLDSLSRSH